MINQETEVKLQTIEEMTNKLSFYSPISSSSNSSYGLTNQSRSPLGSSTTPDSSLKMPMDLPTTPTFDSKPADLSTFESPRKMLNFDLDESYQTELMNASPLSYKNHFGSFKSKAGLATAAIYAPSSLEGFEEAIEFFKQNPNTIKFKSSYAVERMSSFIKIDNKIFKISKNKLGQGSHAYTKWAIDQEGVQYVIKIIPTDSEMAYKKWTNEREILTKLGIQHSALAIDKNDGWRRKTNFPDRAPELSTKKLIILTPYEEKVTTVKEYTQNPRRCLQALDKLEMLHKILCELKKIHDKGIIHNDVTLDNILLKLDEKDQIEKIIFIDFEFSRKLDSKEVQVAPTKDLNGIKCKYAPETISIKETQEFIKMFKLGLQYAENPENMASDRESIKKEQLIAHYKATKEHPLLNEFNLGKIEEIINSGSKGFISPFSDLYKLAKNLMGQTLNKPFFQLSIEEDNEHIHEEFLKQIIDEMTNINPFLRISIEELIKKCEAKITELRSNELSSSSTNPIIFATTSPRAKQQESDTCPAPKQVAKPVKMHKVLKKTNISKEWNF